MKKLIEVTVQDLIDGNACFGRDGGIWYPSGPFTDVSMEYIGTALVERLKAAESALERAENDNTAMNRSGLDSEMERIHIERRFNILFRAARECCMCECDICGKKCPWHEQIIKIVPASEEGFMAWIDAEIAAEDARYQEE